MKKILFFALITLLFNKIAEAQCISTFPHVESFETNNGSWVAGGTGGNWAWGSPSKTNITSAGAGIKCWVTGGLTGSGYNSCERSWVKSPCYDFTNVPYPAIAMKIFWECENTYDGATFQYSTNNGSTWTNLGTSSDPLNCMTANWFNNSNITHLGVSGSCVGSLSTVKQGWAGNIGATVGSCQGGGGSNGWVLAKHCMQNLGGLPNVQFRFAFGAGTNCNAYDGFAFDSIAVFNAAPNVANFTWSCNGNINGVAFANTTTTCANTYSWNFGDAASGALNTSTLPSPTHNFSAAGTYTVTFIAGGPCNKPDTITQTVNIMNLTAISTDITCFGANNGNITATTSTANGTISYSLANGGGVNGTGIFNTVAPGSYTLTATDSKGCSKSILAGILQPSAITLNILATSTTSLCGTNNGIINNTANGGTGALTYSILPSGQLSGNGTFNGLGGGVYTIVVADTKGCTTSKTHTIVSGTPINIISTTPVSPLCANASGGSITVLANGGIGALQYELLPASTTNTTGSFTGLFSNTYTVVIKDANNCTNSTTALIISAPPISVLGINKKDATCFGKNDGSFTATVIGGSGSLNYNIQPTNTTTSNGIFITIAPNNYTLTITDANGCSIQTPVTIALGSPEMFTTITKTDIGCKNLNNDGSAAVTITGGVQPFTYFWNTITPQNTAAITNLFRGTYRVLITDKNNCQTVDSVTIQPATCCTAMYFPNSFTPNNDFNNDYFGVKTYIDLQLKKFAVFNRFGQLVWSTTNINETWNGRFNNTDAEQGTYFYYFQYQCLEDNKEYIRKGDLILFR